MPGWAGASCGRSSAAGASFADSPFDALDGLAPDIATVTAAVDGNPATGGPRVG